MKKAYYYTVVMDRRVYEYFKAYSKKQILKHLEASSCSIYICDPHEQPAPGVGYEDITGIAY